MRSLISTILLISTTYSQSWQWSEPIALTDSNSDNINHSFIYQPFDYFPGYNYLLWEKNFGDSSAIMIMKPVNPNAEFVIRTSRCGTNFTNPCGQVYYDSTFFVVWQSNENGNLDLYGGFWSRFGLTGFHQITSDCLDDINPKICGNDLVWEREGIIVTNNFNIIDTNSVCWGEEVVIDSNFCANPDIQLYSHPVIAYEKIIQDSGKIFISWKSDTTWNLPVCLSPNGDNRFVTFDNNCGGDIWWQYKNNYDWNIKGCYFDLINSFNIYYTENFRFSNSDETIPTVISPILVTENDIYVNLAFESDSTGNKEIFYVNDFFSYSSFNISENLSEDRNPKLSYTAWAEVPYGCYRIWLTWQSFRNNHWQIWGRYADIPWLGIENEPVLHPVNNKLFQNHPNPFNGMTIIPFELRKSGIVKITIFDLLGKEVKTLINQSFKIGKYEITWDGKDKSGKTVSSGFYFYQIKSADFQQTKRLLFLK